MLSIRILRAALCLALAFCLVQLGPGVRTARAALVTTAEAIASDTGRDRIRSFLERVEVRDQLEALGVDPDAARARVSGLSDTEVAMIAGRLDELPAGSGVGEVLLVLALLFLVLIFLDYTGVTDLFPWVNKQSQR
jgi:hypothetical protein